MIDAMSVTTEFNSLFETVTSIAEKVDPVKVNLTLSAAAQALTGLGEKLGRSLINGNAVLDDVNPGCQGCATTLRGWRPSATPTRRPPRAVGRAGPCRNRGAHTQPSAT